MGFKDRLDKNKGNYSAGKTVKSWLDNQFQNKVDGGHRPPQWFRNGLVEKKWLPWFGFLFTDIQIGQNGEEHKDEHTHTSRNTQQKQDDRHELFTTRIKYSNHPQPQPSVS